MTETSEPTLRSSIELPAGVTFTDDERPDAFTMLMGRVVGLRQTIEAIGRATEWNRELVIVLEKLDEAGLWLSTLEGSPIFDQLDSPGGGENP